MDLQLEMLGVGGAQPKEGVLSAIPNSHTSYSSHGEEKREIFPWIKPRFYKAVDSPDSGGSD